ncbi:hypothetical protein DFJ58DRAFT_731139 [Suillus subalutaceus]|uniref:uncharacterized protein n=1 Tax=Suillus subalutaceus TaxID=48586 RepID=UPI001B875F9A|nr:uncharacterized protein DFJ58DRAFT_731139 [Suillus subalutaceus]KAG1844618.1 hypothetical protein DFJ58DRAFT_731139 [Suillus subalutaceus]
MAKKKQSSAEKLTINLPAGKIPDHLDEGLECLDSLLPTINNDKAIHLSEAEWLFSDEENQLQAEDSEVEVEELGVLHEDKDRQSEDRSSMNSAATGAELTFVNMNPSSYSASHKRKQLAEHISADEELPVSKAPSKKQRVVDDKKVRERSIPRSDASEAMADEDADAPRKFTVYVQVWSASTTIEKKSSKAAKGPAMITRGPFKIDTTQTFQKFKEAVAEVLPCRPIMLPVSKFVWKFKNPQNAPRKKIANEAGFEALVDAVMAKRTTENVVVWLYTPKPAKEEEDWDTGNPDHVENPFDFDEEAGQDLGSVSRKALIAEMGNKRLAAETELKNLYTFGQCLIFPDKRVWHDKRGNRYFELNDMWITIWATAIASGRADKTMPPTSIHFLDDKKLKVPTSIRPPPGAPLAEFGEFYHQRQSEQALASAMSDVQVPPVPQPQAAPPAPPFPPHQYRFHPGAYYPPYMHPPYAGGFGYPGLPYYPPPQAHGQLFGGPPPVGLPGEPPSASSSPGVTMSHKVTLSDFCIKYFISDGNQAKLAALEYRPGNQAVETLKEKEWCEIGQFSKLGWQSFLTAHRKFCMAIKSGTWLKPNSE